VVLQVDILVEAAVVQVDILVEAAVVPVDTLAVLDAIRVVVSEVSYVNKKPDSVGLSLLLHLWARTDPFSRKFGFCNITRWTKFTHYYLL
jgi:hypothetical protein